MPAFSIKLLNGFQLFTADGKKIGLKIKKARAMLTYLVCHAGQSVSRDKLAQLLWPDSQPRQARHSLRQALADLRKKITGLDDVLLVESASIELRREQIHSDIHEFITLIKQADIKALQQAVALYQNEFLDGFNTTCQPFEDWKQAQRRYYHERAVYAMDELVSQHLLNGDTDTAIQASKQLLLLDPLREATHQLLMGLYVKQEQPSLAIQQYQTLEKNLASQLSIEPGEQIRKYYQLILKQHQHVTVTSENTQPGNTAQGANCIVTIINLHHYEQLPYTLRTDIDLTLRELSAIHEVQYTGYDDNFICIHNPARLDSDCILQALDIGSQFKQRMDYYQYPDNLAPLHYTIAVIKTPGADTELKDTLQKLDAIFNDSGALQLLIENTLSESLPAHILQHIEASGQTSLFMALPMDIRQNISPAVTFARSAEQNMFLQQLHDSRQQGGGRLITVSGENGSGTTHFALRCMSLAQLHGYTGIYHRFAQHSDITQSALPHSIAAQLLHDKINNDPATLDTFIDERQFNLSQQVFLYDLLQREMPEKLHIIRNSISHQDYLQGRLAFLLTLLTEYLRGGNAKLLLVCDDLPEKPCDEELALLTHLAEQSDTQAIMIIAVGATFAQLEETIRRKAHEHINLTWFSHREVPTLETSVYQRLPYNDNVDTIRHWLTTYTQNLTDDEQALLQRAALLGTEFTATNLLHDAADKAPLLPTLLQKNLLFRVHETYYFRRTLYRDIIYSSIPIQVRQQLHRKLAEACRNEPVHYAWHLYMAADANTAEVLLGAIQSLKASGHYVQALTLINMLEPDNDNHRYTVLLEKAEILSQIKSTALAIQAYEKAQAYAGSARDKTTALIGMASGLTEKQQFRSALQLLDHAEKLLAHTREYYALAQIHYQRGNIYAQQANTNIAIREYKIALQYTAQTHSVALATHIKLQLAGTYISTANISLAHQLLDDCLQQINDTRLGTMIISALTQRAMLDSYQNHNDKAITDMQHAIKLADLSLNAELRMQAYSSAAAIYQNLGDIHLCMQLSGQALHLAQQNADIAKQIENLCRISYCQYLNQSINQAQASLEQAHTLFVEHQDSQAGEIIFTMQAFLDPARQRHYLQQAQDCVTGTVSNIRKLRWCYLAIEFAIQHHYWEQAENYADLLIMLMQADSIPFFIHIAERVRILSSIYNEHSPVDTHNELQEIYQHARKLGLNALLPAYERALQNHTQTAAT